jgi:hypothetical protein
MGEMPDLRNESPESERNFGANGPDFSVLNEMWNEWNRWIQVETSPWLVNAGVLTELVFMEQRFPGWSVYLALQSGGLTFFGDRILYEGDVFLGSQTIDDLGNRCQSTKPA